MRLLPIPYLHPSSPWKIKPKPGNSLTVTRLLPLLPPVRSPQLDKTPHNTYSDRVGRKLKTENKHLARNPQDVFSY